MIRIVYPCNELKKIIRNVSKRDILDLGIDTINKKLIIRKLNENTTIFKIPYDEDVIIREVSQNELP